LFSVSVNAAWMFDRAYIIHADAPMGCENDNGAHADYRVCLEEYPKSSFWVYALGQGKENDNFKDDQAQVSGATGFRQFNTPRSELYNLTMKDVVRSSLFADRHDLYNAITGLNIDAMTNAFKKEGVKFPSDGKKDGVFFPGDVVDDKQDPAVIQKLGKVPGTFTIPVCRNPRGESRSSVWEDKSRNYPCMCGEFGWDDGRWNIKIDKTKRFFQLTGFMFSEDVEDFCSDHNDCEGENSIDWHKDFEAMRKPGDPKIPKKLKHPFKKCTKHNKVDHFGKPEKDQQWGGS